MHFQRLYFLFVLLLSSLVEVSSQNSIGVFDPKDYSDADIEKLRDEIGHKKFLPKGYELQSLLALSFYPELKDVKVKFIKRKKGGPFVSRPTVWSTFFKKPHKRTYKVFFRSNPHSFFDPILMKNMPFNAQVGVLGHELGHTADFIDRGLMKMIRVIAGNLSWRYMDNFEFETDRRAIAHGLGFQILAWSEHASKSLRVNEPNPDNPAKKVDGIIQRERYMRPATIAAEMRELELYSNFLGPDGTFENISSN